MDRLGSSEVEQALAVAAGCRELLAEERRLARPEVPVKLKPTTDQLKEIFSSIPGMGDEDCPGFPVDRCPDELPDLSSHHSVMAKVLKADPGMYHRLKGLKTQRGVSLARLIKPGIDKKGHAMIRSIGAFAGDEDCYCTFGELFSQIVERYHGFSSSASHRSVLDPVVISAEPLDPSGKYVQSVTLSAIRNLRGFRLPCAASLQERAEVERLVSDALFDLGGSREGSYFPLRGSSSYVSCPKGMSEEDEQNLEGAGLLLREPDSALVLASGSGRHWPDARGVFASGSFQTWAWINGEDHLQLFSQLPGSDVRGAFERLCRMDSALEASLAQQGHGYMFDQRLGFLTSCPSNVGPAFSVKLTVQLPLLSARRDFKEFCQLLGLRASRAETGKSWDLLNASSLGFSEAGLVNTTAQACRQLIALEEALARGDDVQRPGFGAEVPHMQPLAHGMPVLSSHSGAAAMVLRSKPEIYAALCNRTTPGGVPFSLVARATLRIPSGIRSANLGTSGRDGVCSDGSSVRFVGLCAGDADCYHVFRELFEPALESATGKSVSCSIHPPACLDPTAVAGESYGIVADSRGKLKALSSRLQLSRNLRGLPFPPACSSAQRREVERVVTKILTRLTGSCSGTYFPLRGSRSFPLMLEGMSEAAEKGLRSKALLMQEPKALGQLACGFGKDWPEARGVFEFLGGEGSETGLAVWINEEDHISFVATRRDGNLKAAFTALCDAEKCVREQLLTEGFEFACSDRLGALTSLPGRLGSGLSVRVQVEMPRLPASSNIASLCEEGLEVALGPVLRGGRPTLEVANSSGFGVSEAGLITSVADACTRIISRT